MYGESKQSVACFPHSRARLRVRGEAAADSEDVAVRVANMHLADMPRHVCGRPGDFQVLIDTATVDGIDIVDPDGHPDALVDRVVADGTEGRCDGAPPPATLAALAQQDFAVAGMDTAEVRWLTPIPALLPPQPLEPGQALLEVRDVENGRHPPCFPLHPRRSCRSISAWHPSRKRPFAEFTDPGTRPVRVNCRTNQRHPLPNELSTRVPRPDLVPCLSTERRSAGNKGEGERCRGIGATG